MNFPFYRKHDIEQDNNGEINAMYKFLSECEFERLVLYTWSSGQKWYSYEKHFDKEINAQFHYDEMIMINENTWANTLQDFLKWTPN